ncbi:AglZ/HisF2 family acetamidino modification protein [Methylophilaceae bacterium]|nr:AglZ/HisF2 family acetamidino modification protein [Methylophilaceae bacterium]
MRNRIIPTLLLKGDSLYKGKEFKDHKYVGDLHNALRVFNNFEVDELMIVDIEASIKKSKIDLNYIRKVVSECFMPLSIGGGINDVDQAKDLISTGVEKIVINSALFGDEAIVRSMVDNLGGQSVVASIDVKKNFFGKYVIYSHSGTKKQSISLENLLDKIYKIGIGEVVINSIDNEGSMSGYDLNLISTVKKNIDIPIVASGGAGSLSDFKAAVKHGAHGVAAGSYFIYHGPRRAVLISYPERYEIDSL